MSAIVLSRRSALLGTTSIVAVGLTSCVPFPTSPQTILSDVRTIMNAANLVWGAVLKVYPKLVSAGAAGIIGQAYSAVSDIIALGQLIWPASNPAPGTPPLDTTQKFVKAVNTFLDLLSQITGILATVVPSPTFTAIAAGLSLALKLATAIETALGVAPPPAPAAAPAPPLLGAAPAAPAPRTLRTIAETYAAQHSADFARQDAPNILATLSQQQ
jgi:hypothetical protein